MAWWQKKLLHYALSRTGLLDDNAIDPKNLDITLGRTNIVELKDVALNIKRISKLAHLPPNMRVETARVLSLRLTVPADIYQSSIVAEVDGVDLSVRLGEGAIGVMSETGKGKAQPRAGIRSPQHRKARRRIHSPPPYDPGGLHGSDDDVHMPTTEEMARSFLLDESAQERRRLEALAAENDMEASTASVNSSTHDEVGTGAGIGLPGFLAGFLQGIVDRFKIQVKNVDAKLETEVGSDGPDRMPATLRLRVGSVDMAPVTDPDHAAGNERRQVKIQDIGVDLLSDATTFSELSELRSPTSPSERRSSGPKSSRGDVHSPEIGQPATSDSIYGSEIFHEANASESSHAGGSGMAGSESLTGLPRRTAERPDSAASDHDIQPGDDNISWASRRSKSSSSGPTEDLWNSMASEDDLPDSMLLERASAARPRPSRDASPLAYRTRRAVSPYDRGIQSPGSRPRLQESPDRSRKEASPGSWPALDQSRQSIFQPAPSGATFEHEEDAMDNKQSALASSSRAYFSPQSPLADASEASTPEHEPTDMEAMAQSRFYSHEEAESMYMSAMTRSPVMHVPGGWGGESHAGVTSPVEERGRFDLDDTEASVEAQRPESENRSGHATPRAQSPETIRSKQRVDDMATKRLITVDEIAVRLPATGSDESSISEGGIGKPRETPPAQSQRRHVPGTFSMYTDMAASQRRGGSGTGSILLPPTQPTDDIADCVELDAGSVACCVDVSACRLLSRVGAMAARSFDSSADTVGKSTSSPTPDAGHGQAFACNVKRLTFSLLEDLPLAGADSFDIGLVSLSCDDVNTIPSPGDFDLRIGKLRTLLSGSELLSFDRAANLSSSVVLAEGTPDVVVTFNSNKTTLSRRPVSELAVETLPVKIDLDLGAMDDTLSSFGGLSGVLELSGSMLSESGKGPSSKFPQKPAKGVRFQGESATAKHGPELKAQARFGGSNVTLRGDACALNLRTTTLKGIYREQGAVATVEHVILSGPHTDQTAAPAVTVDLATLRLEYLTSPHDKDLERLLSLLTPSKDKYDTDDDILLDTLIRQRKKGGLARAAVGNVKVNLADLDFVSSLAALAEELNKLSAVAKYLPEDDRPGLLSLVRVKDFDLQLPVNQRFGMLQVVCQDFHLAHVGLPALLAFSIGTIAANRVDHAELLRPLIPLAGADHLPMLMARMLGDEAEPTVKVKLFNACVEYSVPTISALTSLDVDATPAELMQDMAKSIADISTFHKPESPRENSDPPSSPVTKKTNITLLVHDSAIGLNPNNSPAKALLVLTDAKLSTLVPPVDVTAVSFDLAKAAVFAIDDAQRGNGKEGSPRKHYPANSTTSATLASELTSQGYVSVASVMAAKIDVSVDQTASDQTKAIDVDVRNQLLLLETCADSTQTLSTIFGGLAPPTPPSKQPKYLTEPMTIEDMMASFTGEPEARPEQQPETLFDAEEQRPEDDPKTLLEASTLGEDADDLLMQSEMTQSLYGPVSGMFEETDEQPTEGEPSLAGYDEAVESLLEEDPFEMPTSPVEAGMSDASLMRDLQKQCQPPAEEQAVDLDLYEIEDLGFDALGGQQQPLGSRDRFNTPASRGRTLRHDRPGLKLPFRFRLRDIHLIWNLHDGYDWEHTRDGITQAVEQVEARAEERKARRRQSLQEHEVDEESVIGDVLFNSIYIGVPANHDVQDLRQQINRGIDELASESESIPVSGMSRPTAQSGASRPRQRQRKRLKLERSKAHKIAFELKGLCTDVLVFPPDSTDVVSSIDVRVRELDIFDNVPTSTWRKFLTSLHNSPATREMARPMVHIEMSNVRTLENYAASEMIIHTTLMPLRLHVDQDALDFVVRFFNFKDSTVAEPDGEADQPFIQRLEVETVDLKLDYKPKRIDYGVLRAGNTSELMNIINLEATDIKLKHAIVYGLRGFAPLHKTLNDIWMPDVTRNQLPTVLSGLAPMRSLANIGAGVRDVVAIPVREYKKDGRLVRSVQKGALHFGKTTTSELARLGAKLAMGTQNLLSGAEGLLSPSSASPASRAATVQQGLDDTGWQGIVAGEPEEQEQRPSISAYANQPLGVFSGLRTARRYLEHDLLTARDAFIAVQGEVLDSRNPGALAAAVARGAPTVILRPVIGASRAVGTALLGVGNQIDRGNVRKADDKYKHR